MARVVRLSRTRCVSATFYETELRLCSSDAATDSDPPGMGGWLHGYYWHIALASCFSSLVFRGLLGSDARLTLQTDATAAISTLVRETERSEVLVYAHHRVLHEQSFRDSLALTDLGHLFGDSNIASDLVSRAKWEELDRLAQQLRLRLTQLALPPLLQDVLRDVLNFARQRGQPLRASRIPPPTSRSSYAADDSITKDPPAHQLGALPRWRPE